MSRFQKKPVVIDAVQWTGEVTDELRALFGESALWGDGSEIEVKTSGEPQLVLRTLEGTMLANVGDWIIRGVKGELYPCKPDIFAATYEEPQPTATTTPEVYLKLALRKRALERATTLIDNNQHREAQMLIDMWSRLA